MTALAVDQHNVGCLALDSSTLFFGTADLDRQEGTLSAVPLRGGPAAVLAKGLSPLWPCELAVDGGTAYLSVWSKAEVVAAPLAGGQGLTLATSAGATAIAVDEEYVYWGQNFGVKKVPRTGGEITTLASELGGVQALAIDARYAYWATRDGQPLVGRVLRVPLDGGEVTTLAKDVGTSSGLVVDEQNVYWTDRNLSQVLSVPLDGGDVKVVVADLFLPDDLAQDESNLYFGTSAGSVWKVSKQGGEAIQLAQDAPNVIDLVAGDARVYWTNGSEIRTVSSE